MANWYLGHIRYQREDASGSLKAINESYLLDAVSYTEAEARLFGIVASNTPDFQLIKLAKFKLSEVFILEGGSETWYKCKVNYFSFDEKTQKEKKVPHMMLINSDTPKSAFDNLTLKLGTLNDYEITDINITSILEVHPYVPEEELLKHGKFRPVSDFGNFELTPDGKTKTVDSLPVFPPIDQKAQFPLMGEEQIEIKDESRIHPLNNSLNTDPVF